VSKTKFSSTIDTFKNIFDFMAEQRGTCYAICVHIFVRTTSYSTYCFSECSCATIEDKNNKIKLRDKST
jgi:hypothetical protein